MKHARFSVAQPTTPGLTLDEDLALCAELQIGGIGLDHAAKVDDPTAALSAFRKSGLKATFALPDPNAVLPFIGTRPLPGVSGETNIDHRVARMCASIRTLAPFSPVAYVCISGPMGDRPRGEAYELAVNGLKQAARAAAETETLLALEPIHASLAKEFSFINAVDEALAMLDDIDEPNTGLLIDVWHVGDTPDVAEVLRACARRVAGVHINNRREPTRSWCDRVLPLDGSTDFETFLVSLLDGGYEGWFELEVVSDDGRFGNAWPDSLWKRPPADLVREGQDQFASAFEAAVRAQNGTEP